MKTKFLCLIISIGLLSGCATLFSSGSDEITFTSQPEGAIVMMGSTVLGKTPLKYRIDRDTFKKHDITIKKKGYKSQKIRLQKNLNAVAIFNLSSLLSWATDATSGNMFQYTPTSYYFELERKSRRVKRRAMGIRQTTKFVLFNHKSLQNDLSRGQGEHLNNLSHLVNLPADQRENFRMLLKINQRRLIQQKDAYKFYKELQAIMEQSQDFSHAMI